MLTRINRLIAAFIIVALSLYVVILNRESITVHLSPTYRLTANAGVVMIAVFCLGVLCAALVAVFLGVKAYFRERGLQNREKQRQAFLEAMLKARSLQAAGEWQLARKEWEQIIKRDPSHIIARIELSRSLEGEGQLREALRVLDAARASDPQNIELLFRAAELNLKLNNKTAAIDNLALILYHHPVKKAALMARDLSEQLERIEDALEYQAQLEKLQDFEPDVAEKDAVARLHFKKILRDCSQDKTAMLETCRGFVRRFPEYAPAISKLAELEKDAGNIEAAAQAYVRAARFSNDLAFWRQATQLWISQNMPERALAAARTAAKECRGRARLQAELDLIRVYLSLGMPEEAKRALDDFPELASREEAEIPSEMAQSMLILSGMCLNALGDYKQAAQIWKKLSDNDLQISASKLETKISRDGEPPSPALSTP